MFGREAHHWGSGSAKDGLGQHGPLISSCMRPVVPCGSNNTRHRHQHRPQVLLGHGTRYNPQQQLGPRGHPGSSWQHSPLRSIWPPGCHMTLGHHHGLGRLTRYQVSTGPSVATGAMDINSYPGGYRVTNRHGPWQQPGPRWHHGLWCQHKALRSTWHSDSSKATGCCPDSRLSCGLWSPANLIQAIILLRLSLRWCVNLITKISHCTIKTNPQIPYNLHYFSEKLI